MLRITTSHKHLPGLLFSLHLEATKSLQKNGPAFEKNKKLEISAPYATVDDGTKIYTWTSNPSIYHCLTLHIMKYLSAYPKPEPGMHVVPKWKHVGFPLPCFQFWRWITRPLWKMFVCHGHAIGQQHKSVRAVRNGMFTRILFETQMIIPLSQSLVTGMYFESVWPR